MVRCPLPPAVQIPSDPTLVARLRLLAKRGLTPQIFLPARDLGSLGTLGTRGPGTESRWWSWLRWWRGRRAADGCGFGNLKLPEGVAETLEVFVMEPSHVTALLESEGTDEGAAPGVVPLSEGERTSPLASLHYGLLLEITENFIGSRFLFDSCPAALIRDVPLKFHTRSPINRSSKIERRCSTQISYQMFH